MEPAPDKFSFAFFPFLKTSKSVSIGRFIFRSTDDYSDLNPIQVESLNQLKSMLFLKDNLRIISASYTAIPYIDFDLKHDKNIIDILWHLQNIQAVVSYVYASPHETHGTLFLSSEYSSMVIFSSAYVYTSQVHPNYNTVDIAPIIIEKSNKFGYVLGFAGLYNFKHYFWVSNGSRLYGPTPHPTLNISQDLGANIESLLSPHNDYDALFLFLQWDETPTSSRFFTALRWYNLANNPDIGQLAAIVNLSIAFESLFGFPPESKSDRFVDTIALLLGRFQRLDIWARQFYNVRSKIVHEGYTDNLYFLASDNPKRQNGSPYGSLISYGRHIFQLCLKTLIIGADFAQQKDLKEKLLTNQERFTKVIKILTNTSLSPSQKLESISGTVSRINRYRYVNDDSLKIETMICATKLAANELFLLDNELPNELKVLLSNYSNVNKTTDHFEELDALSKIQLFYSSFTGWHTFYTNVIKEFVDVVWGHVFSHYFYLKDQRDNPTHND